MKKFFIILCAFIFSVSLYAEVFRYKYVQGEKYKIVSEVDESIYIDGEFSHQSRILNKISVEVINTFDNGSGEIEANYVTSEKRSGNVQVYTLSQEYYSTFIRDTTGMITIDPGFFMPVVRNVPLFDSRDLKPGDEWTSEGYEVHDLRKGYGINDVFSYPIKVEYKYLGKGERDGNEYDIISIFYSISFQTPEYFYRYPLYPVRLSGYSDQTLYWDNEAGRPYAYEEEFNIQFSVSNGSTYKFAGTAWASITESDLMDKDRLVDDIEERFEKERLENAVVSVDDKGVTITFGSINFGADSSELTDVEKTKLDTVVDILKSYSDRDLIITGHTALAGTQQGQLELSKQRAAMVAQYFIKDGIKRADQLIITGKGALDPVSDNSTANGMARNRRVEITIVEN